MNESTLEDEIAAVLNRYSRENNSNTPDFILARYLMDCLSAFERASTQREGWYGEFLKPGRPTAGGG